MTTQRVDELTQDVDSAAIINEMNAMNEADGIPVNTGPDIEEEVSVTPESTVITEEPSPDTTATNTQSEAPPITPTQQEPVAATVLEETRRQLAEQEQRLRYYQQAEQSAATQRQTEAMILDLENQGYSQEQAQYTTQRIQEASSDKARTQQAAENYALFLEGKMNAAIHYGEKYSVPVKSLMQYNTPEEMETSAKQSSEMESLKRQIAELKGREAPAQAFEQGRQSAPTASEDRLVDSAMSKPREQRSEAEHAALRRAARG